MMVSVMVLINVTAKSVVQATLLQGVQMDNAVIEATEELV
jgi:hypothetical protein